MDQDIKTKMGGGEGGGVMIDQETQNMFVPVFYIMYQQESRLE